MSEKTIEAMTSSELKKHLEGTGSAPVIVKVKGKEVVGHALKSDLRKAKPSKKAPAKKVKKAPAKKSKPAAKPKRVNQSKIDLDRLKVLVKVKGGSTVPKLMKALRQPRINVSRALGRLGKVFKLSVKREPLDGKPGQRPFVYKLA